MSQHYTTGDGHWDSRRVKELRRRLGLSQQAMAYELGVRQQTVSDWEQDVYAPRGASRLCRESRLVGPWVAALPTLSAPRQDDRANGHAPRQLVMDVSSDEGGDEDVDEPNGSEDAMDELENGSPEADDDQE